MPHRLALLLLTICAFLPAARAAEPSAADLEFFEKKVRPVLAEHCYACHSSKKERGGLRLDSAAAIRKGGDTANFVVPGKPEQSLLIKAIGYKDPELRMPQRSKLPDELIADLTEWVRRGAPLPAGGPVTGSGEFNLEERRKHWSFQPLGKPAVPAVRDRDWVRNPLDAFVLAGLEAKGLTPAAPLDRRALIRRVTFDLIGLPPTPEEVEAFVKDETPDAYEKVVERLLASPHHGERWGRHWLDLVRYAETSGHEFDFEMPEAFRYRDYVVRALNADVPYDQFVMEHLAGDLLPGPRRHPTEKFNESVIGTGFFFLGEGKHSPVDIRAEGAERSDNQIDVFGKAFLGLTISCARCHDHKFDPISTKDYYALAGYLRSSRYQRACIDHPDRFAPHVRDLQAVNRELRSLAVPQAVRSLTATGQLADYLLAAQELGKPGKTPADVARQFKVDEKLLRAFHGRLNQGLPPEHPLSPWKALVGPTDGFAARKKAWLERPRLKAAEVFKDFRQTGTADWFVTGEAFHTDDTATDVRVRPGEALPVRGLIPARVPHSGRLGTKLEGTLRSPTFTIRSNRIHYLLAGQNAKLNLIIDGFQFIRDPIYGGLTKSINHGDAFRWVSQDVSMWVGHQAYIELLDEGGGWLAVDRVVFGDPPTSPLPAPLVEAVSDPKVDSPEKLAGAYQTLVRSLLADWQAGKLDDQPERLALLGAFLDGGLDTLAVAPPEKEREALAALVKKQAEVNGRVPGSTYVMALADGTGENERIFIRGNAKNLGEEAPRRFLEAFAGKDDRPPAEGSGRLELARRVVASPLVPRVMVNRLWHHHFGSGIVRSTDDFGYQGTGATHPELLEWLAGEFVSRKWSLKEMHRLMVLSSAYRMGSQSARGADEADPDNRLWHKVPVRRLEAEAIRDAMLAVSGRLDRKMGGPGVMPHLTPHMQGRGRPGGSGPIDGNGRRSLYINVRRNFLTPLFLAFDYPVPFTTMGRRSVSNVPAQALALLNNPFVKEQADLWAKRVLADKGKTPRERITGMYQAAFGRPPTAEELTDTLAFVEEQTGENRAAEARAWADLAHVLFNVKEFIFIP